MLKKSKIRKNDTVEVIAGKDKGKRGTVVSVLLKKEAVIVSKLGVPRFAVGNVLRVLKEKNPELPITIDNMNRLRAAINKIESADYEIENVSNKVIKEIVDKRIG